MTTELQPKVRGYFRVMRGRLDPSTGEPLHEFRLRSGGKSARTAVFTVAERESLEDMRDLIAGGINTSADFSHGPDGLIEKWGSYVKHK